jgi:hypothetical protein
MISPISSGPASVLLISPKNAALHMPLFLVRAQPSCPRNADSISLNLVPNLRTYFVLKTVFACVLTVLMIS